MKYKKININALSYTERYEINETLYPIVKKIFSGVSKRDFFQTSLSRDSDKTVLYLFFSKSKIIGFNAVHRYQVLIDNKSYTFFRGEFGVLPEHRGKNITTIAGFEIIKYKLLFPYKKIYLIEPLTHPSSYQLFVKYNKEVYPSSSREVPLRIEHLMKQAADIFMWKRLTNSTPIHIETKWVTYSDELKSKNKDALFFTEINPEYINGIGLLTLVPVNYKNSVSTLKKIITNKKRNQ